VGGWKEVTRSGGAVVWMGKVLDRGSQLAVATGEPGLEESQVGGACGRGVGWWYKVRWNRCCKMQWGVLSD
jgi:hypothetical protein